MVFKVHLLTINCVNVTLVEYFKYDPFNNAPSILGPSLCFLWLPHT